MANFPLIGLMLVVVVITLDTSCGQVMMGGMMPGYVPMMVKSMDQGTTEAATSEAATTEAATSEAATSEAATTEAATTDVSQPNSSTNKVETKSDESYSDTTLAAEQQGVDKTTTSSTDITSPAA